MVQGYLIWTRPGLQPSASPNKKYKIGKKGMGFKCEMPLKGSHPRLLTLFREVLEDMVFRGGSLRWTFKRLARPCFQPRPSASWCHEKLLLHRGWTPSSHHVVYTMVDHIFSPQSWNTPFHHWDALAGHSNVKYYKGNNPYLDLGLREEATCHKPHHWVLLLKMAPHPTLLSERSKAG